MRFLTVHSDGYIVGLLGCVCWTFDDWEPVSSVLPGQFSNLVRVLVPDATMTPMEFHDIILEDLVGTPDSQAKLIVPC